MLYQAGFMDIDKLRLFFYLLTGVSLVSTVLADGTAVSAISSTLCGMVTAVRTIVGALALTLFLLGGVMYAVSHFLPTNMEFKKSMTAWSTAMITGGIIGLVIVLIAQPLISTITGLGTAVGGTTSTTPITCS